MGRGLYALVKASALVDTIRTSTCLMKGNYAKERKGMAQEGRTWSIARDPGNKKTDSLIFPLTGNHFTNLAGVYHPWVWILPS